MSASPVFPFIRGLGDIIDGYAAVLCDLWGVLHDGRDAWDLGADGTYTRVDHDTHSGEAGSSPVVEAHGAQAALMARYDAGEPAARKR